MAKKILMIVGSPRKKGNTQRLAEAFQQGAQEAGAQVQLVNLAETPVKGCLDCGGCNKTGRCVQRDGMEAIYEGIQDCDLLVLGTPIFFFTVSAQLKAALDRLHSYAIAIQYKFPKKECVLLAVSGDPEVEHMQQVVTYYRTLTGRLGWTDRGMILATGAKARGAIEGNIALEQAVELGRKVAQD